MESTNLKLCTVNKLYTESLLITKTGSVLWCGECVLPIFLGSYTVDQTTLLSKKVITFYSSIMYTNFF